MLIFRYIKNETNQGIKGKQIFNQKLRIDL